MFNDVLEGVVWCVGEVVSGETVVWLGAVVEVESMVGKESVRTVRGVGV